MINRFRDHLREAVTYRRQAKLPNVVSIITTVSGCIFAYIVCAIILVPSHKPREFNFVSEDGAATALSAILLAGTSALSMATVTALVRAADRRIWFWVVATLGFAFFAFDELLLFHERIGGVVERIAAPGIFRSWDDIIVIAYGVVALPVLIAFLPSLMRYRMVLEMFAVAFAFYGVHTLIDSTFEPKTTVSVILEESAKLYCGAFLALGALVGLIGVLWNYAPFDGTRDDT